MSKDMKLELLIENMNEEDFDLFFDEVVQLVEKYNAFCGGSFMPDKEENEDKNNGKEVS